MSINGKCFDIGNTTMEALNCYLKICDPYSGSNHQSSAGNGSLMRIAPIPLFFFQDLAETIK